MKSINKRFFSSGAIVLFLISFHKVTAQENYFYTNKPYGSESLFNPLTLFINGGYDICQLQSVSNRIGDHQYHKMLNVVLRNLGDPFHSISNYGWNHLLVTELLPISFTKDKMQWIPNYQQHLIGGGMLFTAMKEWYRANNFPVPWFFSAVTVMSQHMFNEVLETGPHEGYSVDEVVDIYIFDLGGIVLFSFDSVNKFFSKTLNLSDWSLQSTITLPNGRVNAGQYFAIKWKYPFTNDYYMFYRYGMGALYGVSKKVDSTDFFSVGIGFKTKHLVDVNKAYRQRTIETGWYAGVFYDRNNSLLASIVMSGVKEYFCMIDIYPGIIEFGDFSPGVWTVIGRDGKIAFGLSTKYALSLGYEARY